MGALVDRFEALRQIDDFRAGQICSLIANSMPGIRRTFQPADFFPNLKRVERRQSPQEMFAILEAMAGSQNARIGQA
jgi:hypothetical protein